MPNVNVRSWRKLIEFRQKLLARRVAVKNQIRAILRGNGIAGAKWQWTRKAIAALRQLELPDGEKLALDLAVEELAELNAKIKRVEKELLKFSSNHPGVALLRTIPGVGIRTAEAFVAYVDDVRRFARNRQVGSYFGLVPCQDSSAGKDRFGGEGRSPPLHITRDGPPTVRKLLCEASWCTLRHNPTIRAFFERVANGDKDRRKIALVAVAHHLCRVMAAMLRTGETWRY